MVGNANANGIPFLKRYGIPSAIKNAMVLWYDIARQGATNESMAKNPILKDLSGNGHDATCYNFAWSGMSGIEGYVLDESNLYKQKPEICSFNKNIVTLNKPLYNTVIFFSDAAYIDANTERVVVNRPAFKIKVSGVGDNEYVKIAGTLFDGNRWSEQNVILNIGNGITDIPAINQTFNQAGTEGKKLVYQDFKVSIVGNSFDTSESIITIEILPQYSNALVSDGVDDYAYVEGLPILTDYTVIAKREWLELSSNFIALASKTANVNNSIFLFEWATNDLSKRTSSFGGTNTFSDWWNDIITYQTKREYNGTTLTLKNEELIDTDNITLLSLNRYGFGGKIALYSFLLFNRTLTKNEIEWVKTNLISIRPNE